MGQAGAKFGPNRRGLVGDKLQGRYDDPAPRCSLESITSNFDCEIGSTSTSSANHKLHAASRASLPTTSAAWPSGVSEPEAIDTGRKEPFDMTMVSIATKLPPYMSSFMVRPSSSANCEPREGVSSFGDPPSVQSGVDQGTSNKLHCQSTRVSQQRQASDCNSSGGSCCKLCHGLRRQQINCPSPSSKEGRANLTGGGDLGISRSRVANWNNCDAFHNITGSSSTVAVNSSGSAGQQHLSSNSAAPERLQALASSGFKELQESATVIDGKNCLAASSIRKHNLFKQQTSPATTTTRATTSLAATDRAAYCPGGFCHADNKSPDFINTSARKSSDLYLPSPPPQTSTRAQLNQLQHYHSLADGPQRQVVVSSDISPVKEPATENTEAEDTCLVSTTANNSPQQQTTTIINSNRVFHPASVFDFSEKFLHQLKFSHQLSSLASDSSEKDSDLKSNPSSGPARQQDSGQKRHLDWSDIATRYGKMPRQQRCNGPGTGAGGLKGSCCYQLLITSLYTIFPILDSFKNYSLPGDLLADLFAGFTIAVLQIPQGMAYGLLAGVDPIYGLYTSFVPVLIMALTSRSRHVSYGTFAVVSMLLANTISNVKVALQHGTMAVSAATSGSQSDLISVRDSTTTSNEGFRPESGRISQLSGGQAPVSAPLVITNNHQPRMDNHRGLLEDWLLTGRDAEQGDDNDTNLFLSTQVVNADQWPLNRNGQALRGVDLNISMPTNIEILTCVCLFVGCIQLIMALTRLGILTLMFSDQLVSSFTTASAVHVVTSQMSSIFDIDLPPLPEEAFKIFRIWSTLIDRLVDGFNYYTAILSLLSILFLVFIKDYIEPKLKRRYASFTCLPSELLLMTILITASWYWKFSETLLVRIIGTVPTGLPTPKMPRLDIVPLVIQDSITIALVSFAMNLSLAHVYAKRHRYKLEPNQELFALGTSNVIGSFFSCVPCASSLSRTAVQSNLSSKSQVTALFSCSIVVTIICFFAPILHDLPRSTLSCIIVVALRAILMQIKDLYENWRLSKLDALVWMVTFAAVISFGVSYGLLLGIAASLFMVFFRLLTPNYSILGQLPGTDIYVDSSAFVECREVEQVKIFRFNSALCYLNRTMFKTSIEKSLPSVYRPRGIDLLSAWKAKQSDEIAKTEFLVIDCSALAYCDYSGAGTLVDIIDELAEHDLQVFLAACPMKLIDMLEKMKATTILQHNVYPTISDAVSQAKYSKSQAGNSRHTDSDKKKSTDLSLNLNHVNVHSSSSGDR